jgi:hypothetical protein
MQVILTLFIPILNRFEECKRGILVRQRCQVDIDSNYFYRNIVGIEINNNRRSSYINKSGSIMIVNNDFRYVTDYGVEVWDNPMVYTYIHNNLFNIFNGFQFDPLMEGKKGIYVHNSSKSQFTSYNSYTTTISGNIIKNYRFGIQTMNQEYGQVSDNTILFDVPDQYLDYQLPVRRAGINFQNTRNIFIATNTVRRIQTNVDPSMIDNSATLNMGTLICGFNIDMSNNSYKENLSFNFPTHYRIANTCDFSIFECNDLSNGLECFKLEGANATITAQGHPDQPNGNKWLSWPSSGATRINGNAQPTFVDWFFDQNSVLLEDPTVNNSIQVPFGIVRRPINYSSCTSNPCLGCDLERMAQILTKIDTLNYSEEQRYALENYVYNNLHDSIQLMYGGTVYDASLQSFFTASAISKIGKFNSIDELIRGNDFASANFRNAELEIDRLSETNLQTVNRIIIQLKGNFDNIDSISYYELLAIAYQFPSIGGEAVFRARAILRIDVDDTELMLRLNGNEVTYPINLVKIVPNPSKGKFRIVDAAGSTQRKYQYSISDDKGRLVKENSDQGNTNSNEIDLSNFNQGIYFVKVVFESGETQNFKLVLIK